MDRDAIARAYIRGTGIEIGALHNPLRVPASANVRYVDRMPVSELREHYPELAAEKLVDVDVVDDGERLATLASETQDFVIANHFLEHCQNPLLALENMLRVLKHGGVLYLAVPDKRFTFDADRPVTPLEHLRRDYEEGPEWSRRQHFEEWVQLVNRVSDPERASEETERLVEQNYSIHFHVWTPLRFVELLLYCRRELGLPLELEAMQQNGIEFIVVLAKGPGE